MRKYPLADACGLMTICMLAVFILFHFITWVVSKHIGIVEYHFYEGGRTALGLKGSVTTLTSPPEFYGFEVDGHAVETDKQMWSTITDGQRVHYTEVKSIYGVDYSTEP